MNKITTILLTIISITVISLSAARRPNVILFITDDQSPFTWAYKKDVSASGFGFNGEKHVYTPEIDRLAKDGMVFTRAYVSSSVCSPSRYTSLTGRYASRSRGKVFMHLHPEGTMTRVENNTELEEDKLNVAKVLKANGYKTAFVGKSHIVDHDALNQPQHWDSHWGLKGYKISDDPRDPEINKRFQHNYKEWQKRISRHGFDYVGGQYSGNLRELYNEAANVHNVEWTTHAAIEFIKESGDNPFFMYYATTTPHGPAPWIEDGGKYPHGLDADPKMTGEGYVEKDYSFMPSRDEIKKIAKENGASGFDAWLTWIDASIGAIRKQLEKQGILDDTLFIITSDHGAWRYGKTTLYEGGVRIPLAMHWPNGIKAGSIYDELVQNIDFTPTILDIAGVTKPNDMHVDGLSLKPVFEGSRKPLRDYLYSELGYSRGVYTKDWKYVAVRYTDEINKQIKNGRKFDAFHKGETVNQPYLTRNQHLGHHASSHNPNYFTPDQLYNLSNDPTEENNIADLHPGKVQEMKALLKEKLVSFPNRPFGEFTK